MSSIKLTFYVLLFCILTIIVQSFFDSNNHLQLLITSSMWMFAIMLALVPTVISLVFMVIAVRQIGSTPTAIMGALPKTAIFYRSGEKAKALKSLNFRAFTLIYYLLSRCVRDSNS